MSKFGGRGYGLCILFVVVGAILGGILGELLRGVEALQGIIPYLVQTYPVLELQPAILNLYVINSIVPDVKLPTVLLGALPFMLLMVLGIVILCIFPGIATWLPELLMGPAL